MSELLRRRDLAFILTSLSPLHIGSGVWREELLPKISESGVERAVPVAAIQRDHAQKPWIPGSTIKGALLGLARALKLAAAAQLFGEVAGADSGRMGAVLVRGASMHKAGPTTGLPYASDGVFVLSRTAIDAGRGISDRNKLFHSEVIAPGAEFAIRLRIEARGDLDALEDTLLQVLTAFASPQGVSIGADQASGQGKLTLVGDVTVSTFRAGIDGRLVQSTQMARKLAAPTKLAATRTLRFVCKDPYLSRDPSWTIEKRNEQKTVNHQLPHLKPLQLDAQPFVTGQSVSGALRARLAWLEAAEKIKEGKVVPPPCTEVKTASAAARLQSHERLFGVTGFRGLLQVGVQTISSGAASDMTSVRIDRFAGGSIDNALFTTEAHHDVRISLELTFDRTRETTDADRDALDRLIAVISRNGLRIGHGTTRGFGWFSVEV